jgi:hypothetical protein
MAAKAKRMAKTAVREYVPFEDDPTAAGGAPEGAADASAQESPKPSMREVFGPGGFLEKCMVAGFDRATVSSDYEYRPAQLEITLLWKQARGRGRRWRTFCRQFAADAVW